MIKTEAPLGAIASIFLYLLSVYWSVWDELGFWSRIGLALGLILLFFSDYRSYFLKREK
jgi:hypothetical protein